MVAFAEKALAIVDAFKAIFIGDRLFVTFTRKGAK